ncbi:haloacid dehalogenase [Aulographum hederae CBS 113979]|uniref:Haloacid dehalogenase n=1 Tax=Aulographum hederae CBS 113979 TaxID=1176131 RepID=A0A6G1HHH1_9PEZI|nr:haloacid dehalogenase [Aulographum hederae CBS 113979]
MSRPRPKAIFFDLMGTCLDWHSSILPALPGTSPEPSHQDISQFALDWRQGFFDELHARFLRGDAQEDIDVTHRRVLDSLLEARNVDWTEEERVRAVGSWHCMKAWPDVPDALEKLRRQSEIFVLANGTTRLQLDLVKSSGLHFHMLFSSQLLGLTKPDPAMYKKAVSLVGVEPEECFMVAAHAYDLRAAKAIGMRTAYIQRWTEDPQEDMAKVQSENDLFFDGRCGTAAGGMYQLADQLAKVP